MIVISSCAVGGTLFQCINSSKIPKEAFEDVFFD